MSQRIFTFPLVFFLCFLLFSCCALDICELNDHGAYERIGCEGEGQMMKSLRAKCRKPHFVLVHGHGGAAWNWYKVRAILETYGFKVTTLDLKSAGIDGSDACDIHTFEEYNKPLMDYMASLSDHEKVVLVGHSAGGISVTAASHKFAKKILVAVYVTATMLKHGYLTEEDKEIGVPEYAILMLNQTCVPTPDLPTTTSDTSKLDSAPREVEVLRSILHRPKLPPKVLLQAKFEGHGADNVRNVYVLTRYDRILLPKQQAAMIEKWPPSETYFLNCGHSATIDEPFVLSGVLVKAANNIECN